MDSLQELSSKTWGAELMEDIIIVTSHPNLVKWLAQEGITGAVMEKVTRQDIKGKVVYGSLPTYLAAEALEYNTIAIPGIENARDTKNVTVNEMNLFGARIETYRIERIKKSKV